MDRTPKETVYDAEVHPLMAQIIAICKKHKIAMLEDFDLGPDPDHGSNLKCTTALLSPQYDPSDTQLQAFEILMRQPSLMALTITTEKSDE